MKAGDRILIGLTVIISLFLLSRQLYAPSGVKKACVFENGALVREINCGTDTELPVSAAGGNMRIEIKGGRVRVAASICPGHLCMHTGWIDKSGQSIICVPNRAVIELKGGSPAVYDAVTR